MSEHEDTRPPSEPPRGEAQRGEAQRGEAQRGETKPETPARTRHFFWGGTAPPARAPRSHTPRFSLARLRERHFSMLRSFALADFVTLANAACGTSAILLCLSYVEARASGIMWVALALFPLALLFDVLDGSIARWRRRSSAYGADLDSLADVVSFGVAPAVLGYTLGMRGGWDAVILVYFVGCGISRLARYNVTAASLTTDKGKVSHYEGTPIPVSLLLVAVLAAAFSQGGVHEALWGGAIELGPFTLHPLSLLYALSGSAMISATLKIPKP